MSKWLIGFLIADIVAIGALAAYWTTTNRSGQTPTAAVPPPSADGIIRESEPFTPPPRANSVVATRSASGEQPFSGEVVSSQIAHVTVPPRSEGRVLRIFHDVGDRVSAGSPLAEVAMEPRDGSTASSSNSPYLQNYKRDRINRTLDDLREAEDRLRIARLPRGREEVRRQELEVARRRAAISEAEARLRSARAQSADTLKTDIARQEAEGARAKLEYAAKKLERDRILFEREVIARAELDQSQRDHDVAKNEHDEAVSRLKLVDAAPNSDEIAAAQASLNQARIAFESERDLLHQMRTSSSGEEIRRAQAQLDRAQAAYRSSLTIPESGASTMTSPALGTRIYVLRAPIDGTVIARNLNVGEVAAYVIPRADRAVGAYHEARSSFVVADTSRLEFKAYFPHSQYSTVQPGSRLRVRLDSNPDALLMGTVSRTAPVASSEAGASGVFPVWVRFSSPRPLILGERGTIELEDGEKGL